MEGMHLGLPQRHAEEIPSKKNDNLELQSTVQLLHSIVANNFGLSAAKIWMKTPTMMLRKFCKIISRLLKKNNKNPKMIWDGSDLPKSIPKRPYRSRTIEAHCLSIHLQIIPKQSEKVEIVSTNASLISPNKE